MKRLAMTTAAALALGVGFASSAHAQHRGPGYNQAPPARVQHQTQRWDARQHNGYLYQGRFYEGRPNAQIQRHHTYRPAYQAVRWDARRHNGYSYQGRWYYGEPTRQVMQHRSYEPGYRSWRRGDRLTNQHRAQYQRVDYRSARLSPPPRGYEYRRSSTGETLLVAVATGVILSVILSGR